MHTQIDHNLHARRTSQVLAHTRALRTTVGFEGAFRMSPFGHSQTA
jgi:hypothetical protein